MINKKLDLEYIENMGLHDSIIESFDINYREKYISIILENFFEDEDKKLYIRLNGIRKCNMNKEDDFKNEEIILDYNINVNENQIDIFTTSNSRYEIAFSDYLIDVVD